MSTPPPTMIELMIRATLGISVAEQRVQERIKQDREKRKANKNKKAGKKK